MRNRQRIIGLFAMLLVLLANRVQLSTWEGAASFIYEALVGACLGLGISMLLLSLLPKETHEKLVEWKKKHIFRG